jgi:hypothetical protein
LCKWRWKLESGDGLWQKLVKAKYKITHGIWRVRLEANDSPVWRILLKLMDIYLKGRKMIIGDGKSTDFWHEAWCGTKPLYEQFTLPFLVCNQQNLAVREMYDVNWNLTFRRLLEPGATESAWSPEKSIAFCAPKQHT